MTRTLFAILCLYIGTFGMTHAQDCTADTSFTDILFVIDNSGSIDVNEYNEFENLIVTTIDKVQDKCTDSQIGVVHYGGPFGAQTAIEYPFSSATTITEVNRQFCQSANCPGAGGDDLNEAMGQILGYIGSGALNRDPMNKLVIVIMTDAFAETPPCDDEDCSVVEPFTNIDILKGAFDAEVTVVGMSDQARAAKLAIYASPGGTFNGVSLNPADCTDTYDGCEVPRKYIPLEFNDPIGPASDEILGFVECSVEVFAPLTAEITANRDTICEDLMQSATMAVNILSGEGPFTVEWNQNLGFGLNKTVMPMMTTTYTAMITDNNGCTVTEEYTIYVEQQCIDPCLNLTLDITGDANVCANLNESSTLVADFDGAAEPISYMWDQGLGTGATQVVQPIVTTTYTVTATDANDCVQTQTFTVNANTCTVCQAYAGRPLDFIELCQTGSSTIINTDNNNGRVIPAGFETVYILSDADLTILDYRVGQGTFSVSQPGIYRVHTLIAEVTNRASPDYLDLGIITRGRSNIYIIANCIFDHGICADFDYAGRVNKVLEPSDMMCMRVENSITLCSDNRDNDGDGLVDCSDPDCQALSICLENTVVACNDLFDNDNDGLVDCYDPDCWEFVRCYEKEENCNDGIDNDGDGLVDCEDDSCASSAQCMENNQYTCKDGIDNDGDGLVDCQEAACQRFIACNEFSVEACTDGIDNDFDGLVDCQDMDCMMVLPNTCAPSESTLALCSDGLDNDGDGLTDCMDGDCGFLALQALEANIEDYITLIQAGCPNNFDGAIELTGALATGDYQYQVDGGDLQTNPVFMNIEAGEHVVTISTITQCQISVTVIVPASDCTEICDNGIDDDGDGLTDCDDPDCGITGFAGNINVTDPSCPRLNDGEINITGQVEGISYQYSRDGGRSYQDSPVFSGLIPGNYIVVIRTEVGCILTQSIELSTTSCVEICDNGIDDDGDGFTDCEDIDCGMTGFAGNITHFDPSCPDNNNGEISVAGQISGFSYTYSLTPGPTNQASPVFSGLTGGQYELTVTSTNGCTYSESFNLNAIECVEICDNDFDDDGDGLTDCEDPDCGVSDFDITIFATTCPDLEDGIIRITPPSEELTYSYSLDSGLTYQQSSEFTDLVPGRYDLRIVASSGCHRDYAVQVLASDCSEICNDNIDNDGDGLTDCEDPDCGIASIMDSIETVPVTCPSQTDGTIIIGGQLEGINYVYSIDGGTSFSTATTYTGLRPLDYTVVVMTDAGCTFSTTVTVGDTECPEICGDGIDNDRDGLVDCEDPFCGVTGFSDDIVLTQPTCPDLNNGSIQINGQFAIIDYEYSINAGINLQQEPLFTGLAPGVYDIYIRTMDGCTYETVVELTGETCLTDEICDDGIDNDGDGLTDCEDSDCGIAALSYTGGSATCPTLSDGSIEVTGQLAGVTYEYSIDGVVFQSESVFSDLDTGVYTVTVRTGGGCEAVGEVLILGQSCSEICDDGIDNDGDGLTDCEDSDCGIAALSYTGGSATCPTLSDGSIEVTGQVAGVSYEYSLDGVVFQSESVFNDLDTGVYTVTVRTGGGCEATGEVLILGQSCSEICDDGIDNDGDGLTDCEDSDCGILALSYTGGSATCPSLSDGSIEVTGQIAGVTYEYSLDGVVFQSESNFSDLDTGVYTVTVRTGGGCEATGEVLILGQSCSEICDDGIDNDGDGLTDCEDSDCGIAALSYTDGSATCPTLSDGSIEVTGQVAGVTYEYSLDGILFQSESVFSDLDTGSYTVTVRTGGGCEATGEVLILGQSCSEICDDGIDNDGDGLTDCEDSDCGITALSYTGGSATCPTLNDGSIEVTGQVAGVSYEYSLDGVLFQSESVFSDLDTGTYTVTVRTNGGCEATGEVLILGQSCSEICDDGIDNDGDGLTDCEDSDCGITALSYTGGSATCPTLNDGSIEVTGQVAGVTYEYSLDGILFQSESVFSDLDTGVYTVTVRTGGGCEATGEVLILGQSCSEICDDGIDNDGDGLTDCEDPDCGIAALDVVVLPATCEDSLAGRIEIINQIAGLNYSYSLSGSGQTTPVFSQLREGVYQLTVTTDAGCEYNTAVTVDREECTTVAGCGITDRQVEIVDAICPDDNGVAVYGGDWDSLSFSLDGLRFTEEGIFDSLAAGDYFLYILTDEEKCLDSIPFIVGEFCPEGSSFEETDVKIEVTATLQGAFDSETGLMTTHLNEQGYLPGQKPRTFFGQPVEAGQPYNQAPWFYSGDEGISAGFLESDSEMYESTVVDWVLVSLRTGVTKSSQVWQGAALIHTDGYIDIISPPSDKFLSESEYYIVIEHRNHLPVMSAYPVSVINGEFAYDFSAQDSYTSIIGVGQIKLDDGRYAMIAGNGELITEISSHIDINVRDLNSWLQENGSNSSYFLEDYDMNGDINIKDRILWEKNNGLFSGMPNR